jgi:hypothetical protein
MHTAYPDLARGAKDPNRTFRVLPAFKSGRVDGCQTVGRWRVLEV